MPVDRVRVWATARPYRECVLALVAAELPPPREVMLVWNNAAPTAPPPPTPTAPAIAPTTATATARTAGEPRGRSFAVVVPKGPRSGAATPVATTFFTVGTAAGDGAVACGDVRPGTAVHVAEAIRGGRRRDTLLVRGELGGAYGARARARRERVAHTVAAVGRVGRVEEARRRGGRRGQGFAG